ncbi:MAG: diguanylate cyclase [Raoultibacter sp.]
MIERNTQSEAEDLALFNATLLDVVLGVNDGFASPLRFTQALEKVRDFFRFGSVFVYESDPQKRLVLHEHSATFAHDALVPSFTLEELFSPQEITYIENNPWCCATKNFDRNSLQIKLSSFFDEESSFVVFIIGEEGNIIGCVGMADKRKHHPLTETEFSQAQTILGLIMRRSHSRIYKRRLEYTGAALENIMDHLGFDIYVNDFETHEMLYANKSMAEPYGGWKNMQDKTCHEALYDGQQEECEYCPKKELIDEQGQPSKIHSWDYQRPFDGTWFRVICAAFEWVDGRMAQVVSSTDINEAKNNELLIRRMAFHDQLTGIGNRRKLEADFHELLKEPNKIEKGISLIFLDLDGFKGVNDTYGHVGGDALLTHISTLFQENELTRNRCYRYGGDEFIFLLENISVEETFDKGNHILEVLQTPLKIENELVSCKGSFGVAHYPDDNTDFWKLLDLADDKMYERKQRSKANTRSAR